MVPVALEWVQCDYWGSVRAIGWFLHRGPAIDTIVELRVCSLLPATMIAMSNPLSSARQAACRAAAPTP